MDYPKLIELFEEAMRKGGLGPLHQELEGLKISDIPSQYRLPIARICRRAESLVRGLRILKPLIDSTRNSKPDEIIEYSHYLNELGLFDQAFEQIERIDTEEHPEALFLRMWIQMSQWNHRDAVVALNQFIESPLVEPYRKIVGRVNRISCYYWLNQFEDARTELTQIRQTCSENEWHRLLSNCHELEARILIEEKQFDEALKQLEHAEKLIRSQKLAESVSIRKWVAIAEAYKSGSTDGLFELRREYKESREWESLRSLDFHSLRIEYSDHLHQFLYYGTPYPNFRQKVAEEFGVPRASFYFPEKREGVFEYSTGLLNGRELFSSENSIYQFLGFLLGDFYRPPRTGEVFRHLFPDEFFDPEHSINKVHQMISRSRKWMHSKSLNVDVQEDKGEYRLVFDPGLCVLINLDEMKFSGSFAMQLNRLHRVYGGEEFSSAQAQEEMSKSFSSMNRILKSGIDEGLLIKEGTGSKVRYRFND